MNGQAPGTNDWFHSINIHIASRGQSITAAIEVLKTEDGSKGWKDWLNQNSRTPEQTTLFNALLSLLVAIQEVDKTKDNA